MIRSADPEAPEGGALGTEPGRRRRRSESGDSWGDFLRELPILLLIAFGLAFLLRTFVIQVFWIPSESMAPALQENDRIIVEKITYRFRQPRRGEVVVFEDEDVGGVGDTSAVSDVLRGVGQFLGVVPANARDLVKRVIGLPDDTVLIEDGTVRVNGEPITEPYVTSTDPRDFGPFDVPPGAVFVLGDNRPNSADSRFGLGYVDMDRIVGRAVLVLWPPSRIQGLGAAGQLDAPPPSAAPAAEVPRAPPVLRDAA